MGLPEPADDKSFMKSDYDGWYKTDVYTRLRLVFPQLPQFFKILLFILGKAPVYDSVPLSLWT